MADETAPIISTGYTRKLRERLAGARKRLGINQDEVAARIVELAEDLRQRYPDEEYTDLDTLTGATVSKWELFKSHPNIDIMALWANAVGLRLVVELDAIGGKRLGVMLHAHTIEIATALDLAAPEDREWVRAKLVSMGILEDRSTNR